MEGAVAFDARDGEVRDVLGGGRAAHLHGDDYPSIERAQHPFLTLDTVVSGPRITR